MSWSDLIWYSDWIRPLVAAQQAVPLDGGRWGLRVLLATGEWRLLDSSRAAFVCCCDAASVFLDTLRG